MSEMSPEEMSIWDISRELLAGLVGFTGCLLILPFYIINEISVAIMSTLMSIFYTASTFISCNDTNCD